MGFGLIFLAVLLSAACGSKLIRGAAPMVRMTELSHQDNKVTLQISMRNPNGVALDIQTIDFSLSASDNELFAHQGSINTNIVANGTETWSLEVEEDQNSKTLLDELQSGDIKSLPYSLKGSVSTREEGVLFFEHEGHIYPLPGRPGHFR
ncbi:MAG: LEA type 2 family protein [Gammaproteobacteria bacterium]|nr:LEA type 2 family protein [Gammaproteobacteria bacterium]